MAPLNFYRVHNRHLSLWQSAVADHVRKELQKNNTEVTQTMIMQHPMVTAAAIHVEATFENRPLSAAHLNLSIPQQLNAYLSHLAYEKAEASVSGDPVKAEALGIEYRKFSDKDLGFASCEFTYIYYRTQYGTMLYHDWQVEGGNDMNYGLIKYRLPNDAKVVVVGDWGTGLDDAVAMLTQIIETYAPNVIIHLGDIYYSGTPDECSNSFVDAIATAISQSKTIDIPVFTIPGNHDYYAFGHGFYPMLKQLNLSIPGAAQEASYFCLRTEDDGWQFLGMDTGYDDSDPLNQLNPSIAGPALQASEILWHMDKLEKFDGTTILLSHHQLFSANAKINGMLSDRSLLPFLNTSLYETFAGYLQTDVAAWLWGHEHNFVAFQNGLLALEKGRLVGCSAFEELSSANPYQVNYPQVPYLSDGNNGSYELGTNTDPNGIGYYNHAFAIIDLSKRIMASDPVNISYYQYPSWGAIRPDAPEPVLLFTETLSKPVIPVPVVLQYGDQLRLCAQEGVSVSGLSYEAPYYYPVMATDEQAVLQINASGATGPVGNEAVVNIATTDPSVGAHCNLGAWATPSLYYYSGNYDQLQWKICKKDLSNGTTIQRGDWVAFFNVHYEQYMIPNWKGSGPVYMTTASGDPYYWQII